MASQLSDGTAEMEPFFDRLINEHGIHGHLKHKHDVRIDWLFATPPCDEDGEPTGPALKVGGYPALGQCRIVSYRDRVKGCGDIEITIDSEWWDDATDQQRLALLDHELNHAKVETTPGGNTVRDDHDRPKIKLRKHDHQFGWFAAVAERWGTNSVEVQQATRLREDFKQQYFDFTPREPQPGSEATDDGNNVISITG